MAEEISPSYAIGGRRVKMLMEHLREMRDLHNDFNQEFFDRVEKYYAQHGFVTKDQFAALDRLSDYYDAKKPEYNFQIEGL